MSVKLKVGEYKQILKVAIDFIDSLAVNDADWIAQLEMRPDRCRPSGKWDEPAAECTPSATQSLDSRPGRVPMTIPTGHTVD